MLNFAFNRILTFFTSKEEVMFSLALVCLFVNMQDYGKTTRPFFEKFDGKAAHEP